MLIFTIRRAVQKLIILFFASVLAFLLVHLAPGEPSQIDPLNPRFTKEDLARYRAAFDLDKPLVVQYWRFYHKLFTGTLTSFKDNRPVLDKIMERFMNSVPLFIVGVILTWTLAFPFGISAALQRGRWYDRSATFVSYTLISVPGFFLAYLLIIFVVQTFHVPVLGMRTFGREGVGFWFASMDRLWHLVLPSFLGVSGGLALMSRYVRAQMLEVLGQDYVRTARSKGLPEETVIYKHTLRNALLPFATMFGLLLPAMIGGSVITEKIFAWPGIGRMAYEAVLTRDYPIILALNFIVAVLTVAGTLLSDILYMLVDPRIRLQD
jgi:peptide/nickel transport system permease protein